MNYLDLFSGIGGFHLGLAQAGFKFNWVGFSEIDKYATQIYKERFKDAEELGSIINIRPETLPKIDLITFGFPCQDLSVAGKRSGLSGQRSGLFFEAMRIIEATKPTIFIFENVKGLLTNKGGKDFESVRRTIADFRLYECEWQLLDTGWFLPQDRERVYFIGHLRGKSRPKVFPFRECDFKNISKNKIRKIHKIFKETEKLSAAFRIRDTGGNSTTLIGLAGGMGGKAGLYAICDSGVNRTKQIRTKNTPPLRVGGGGSGNSITLVSDTIVRKPTPVECCRLQGFPDNWVGGLSDTQKYKTLGNAVSVPVVKAIGERLL